MSAFPVYVVFERNISFSDSSFCLYFFTDITFEAISKAARTRVPPKSTKFEKRRSESNDPSLLSFSPSEMYLSLSFDWLSPFSDPEKFLTDNYVAEMIGLHLGFTKTLLY